MKIAIIGGRIIDPSQNLDSQTDLFIADRKIVAIGKAPDAFSADYTIDAKNLIVSPGLVDLSAAIYHPDFGLSSIQTELACAIKSGITTLCWMPVSTHTTPLAMTSIINQAKKMSKLKILPVAPLTVQLEGKQLNELATLRDAISCVAVTNGLHPIADTSIKRRCYQYAKMLDLKVFIYPQDPWLAKGSVHEGEISSRLGLKGIPTSAESIGLHQELELIAETEITAHFCRISSQKSLDILTKAKEKQLPISADVAAYQLYLNELDVSTYNSVFHVLPPLRTESDRVGLIEGVQKNIISAICSNHCPQPVLAKNAPFEETQPGISALETFLPLTLNLSEANHSLMNVFAKITTHPAAILGIDAGSLTPGSTADICIFNLNHAYTFTQKDLCSLGKNTPFLNWHLRGRVEYTLIDGKIEYQRT